MNKRRENLLPREVLERDALTLKFSNIKPKVTKRFKRLTNIFSRLAIFSILLFFLSGYYPVVNFPPIKQTVILAYEIEQNHEILAASFPQPVVLPHPGYLSTRFSKYHPGIDIASGLGMPVHAVTAGFVEETNYGFWGYGNHIIISHANGFKSLYGHLGRIFVKKGQEVTSENTLGEVGMSGHTSGPHTHLEITKDGGFIDPLMILPEISDMPKM